MWEQRKGEVCPKFDRLIAIGFNPSCEAKENAPTSGGLHFGYDSSYQFRTNP